MHAYIILAEGVDRHPDRTFTVFKGGITRVIAAGFPALHRGAVLVRLIGGVGEEGPHRFTLRCVSEDGTDIFRPDDDEVHEIALNIEDGYGSANLIFHLNITFHAYGTYRFLLTVGNEQMAELPFVVRNAPE